MKLTGLVALALCALSGSVLAQGAATQVHWSSEQQVTNSYQIHSQTQFVQQRFLRTQAISTGVHWIVGFSQGQAHTQAYLDSHTSLSDPITQQGMVMGFMLDDGTRLQTQLISHEQVGRVQQQGFSQQQQLGPVSWQLGFEQARLLDQSAQLDQWAMSFAWQGPVRAQIMLVHGDDLQHYAQGDDTRMLLGVEKTFDF